MTPANKKKTVKKATKKKAVTKKKATAKKVTTKKAVKKKAASPRKAATKKAASKPARSSKPAKSAQLNITLEERWKMIAVAAYHKAEKRGFVAGHELDDWTEAEKEISKLLNG